MEQKFNFNDKKLTTVAQAIFPAHISLLAGCLAAWLPVNLISGHNFLPNVLTHFYFGVNKLRHIGTFSYIVCYILVHAQEGPGGDRPCVCLLDTVVLESIPELSALGTLACVTSLRTGAPSSTSCKSQTEQKGNGETCS